MSDLLDIVEIVITSLPNLSWFVYLMGAIVVCACAAFTLRLLYWR